MDTAQTSDSDSDSEGNEICIGNAEPSYSLPFSTDDTNFLDRIDKMSTELDGLVKFVRRGTESLAGEAGEAALAFGVLAFALEDWDP